MKNRFAEFDIMRSVAILAILFCHIYDYAPLKFLEPVNEYFAFFGLSVFVFISGYLIDSHYNGICDKSEIISFIKSRILRIYPLYLPALFIFVILHYHLHDTFSMSNTLIHIVGAQVLLAPRIYPLPTIWFMGLIMSYYVLYILITRCTEGLSQIISRAILLFALFGIAHIVFNLFDTRFFIYFLNFLLGIVLNRINLLAMNGRKLKLVLFLAIAMIASIVVYKIFVWSIGVSFKRGGLSKSLGIIFFQIGILSFPLFIFSLVRLCTGKAFNITRYISLSSYAAYLFHRPMFFCMNAVMRKIFCFEIGSRYLLLVFIGLPMLFVFSYVLHLLERKAIKKITLSFNV